MLKLIITTLDQVEINWVIIMNAFILVPIHCRHLDAPQNMLLYESSRFGYWHLKHRLKNHPIRCILRNHNSRKCTRESLVLKAIYTLILIAVPPVLISASPQVVSLAQTRLLLISRLSPKSAIFVVVCVCCPIGRSRCFNAHPGHASLERLLSALLPLFRSPSCFLMAVVWSLSALRRLSPSSMLSFSITKAFHCHKSSPGRLNRHISISFLVGFDVSWFLSRQNSYRSSISWLSSCRTGLPVFGCVNVGRGGG